MLQVANLSFDYRDEPVLKQVNFTLLPQQLLHIKGSNGAGKTTLLKLVCGLLTPTQGSIYFQHQQLAKNLRQFQRQICYVGHKAGVNLALTVRENVQFENHYGSRPVELERWLREFSLFGLEHVQCGRLSAGQRRRVGLLRLFVSDAVLWILDEPLVALDSQGIDSLKTCIQQHLSSGGAVIMASHQPLGLATDHCREYCL